jgi:hypothetical protein
MTKRIKLDLIRLDGGTQPRAEIDAETVSVYADAIENGDPFPAVDVFYDGEYYWLSDGFHRVHANKQVGFAELDCNVHQGTRRDAVLFAVGANREHGLRRTNADKRRAVNTLLNDKEWSGMSDREVSRLCGVSHQFVSNLRPSICQPLTDERRATRDGNTYTINTANIGRSPRLTVEPNIPSAHDEGSTRPEPPAQHRGKLVTATQEPTLDDCSPAFSQAWNELFREVKNAKALKWKTVPKSVALKQIQILIDIIEI